MLRYTKCLSFLCFIVLTLQTLTSVAQNVVSTYSGNGNRGFNNGAVDTATFYAPFGLCIDKNNNIYVADNGNNCIRKINTVTGIVETLAGTGSPGWKDGRGDTAQFNNPTDVCVDDSGNVYVSDFLNQRIRKISFQGMVSTIAGSGTAGFADGSVATARFNYPRGIVRDHAGNLYVADSWNHRIRKINTSGTVTTYAGGGSVIGVNSVGALVNANDTSARFYTPSGLAIDQSGNIYVADAYNHRIRMISTSQAVTTYAGVGTTGPGNGGFMNGNLSTAIFNTPTEVFVDTITNKMYVGDTFNDLIRKIDVASSMVTTYAGNRTPAFTNGADTLASFNFPRGVVVDSSGKKVYVSDFNNNAIRLIAPQNANDVLEKKSINDVMIYPNPSSSFITITSMFGNFRVSRLEIFDMIGNRIKEIKPTEDRFSIDISAFAKGVYIFKVTFDSDNHLSVCSKVIRY